MKSVTAKLSRESKKAERRRKKAGTDDDDAYSFAASSQGSSQGSSQRSALSRSMQQHARVLQDGDGTLEDMILDDDDFGDIGYAKPLSGASSHGNGSPGRSNSQRSLDISDDNGDYGVDPQQQIMGSGSYDQDDQGYHQQHDDTNNMGGGQPPEQGYYPTDDYTYGGGISTITDPTMMNNMGNQYPQQQQQQQQTIYEGEDGEEDTTYYDDENQDNMMHQHPNDDNTYDNNGSANGGGGSLLRNANTHIPINNHQLNVSEELIDDDTSMASSAMGSAAYAKPLRDGSGRSLSSGGDSSLSSSKKGISLNADSNTIRNNAAPGGGDDDPPLIPYANNGDNNSSQPSSGWQDINETDDQSVVSAKSRSILKNPRYANTNRSARSMSSDGSTGVGGSGSGSGGAGGWGGVGGGSGNRSVRSGWGGGGSYRSQPGSDQFHDEPSVSGYSYGAASRGGASRSYGGGGGDDAKTVYTAYTSATAKRFQSNAPMKQAAQVKALVCLLCFVVAVVFSIFYVSNGNIGLWMTSRFIEHDPITTIEKDNTGVGVIPGTLTRPAFINSTFGEIPDLESMNLALPFDYEKGYADWTISFPAANLTDVPLLWTIPRAGVNVIKKILGKCYGLIQVSSEGANRFEPMLMVLETPQGERYLNVDSTVLPGLNRAKELQLAQSGLAEVMYTHLIPDAGSIFTRKNRGRLFAIFRDPLERAVSLYNHAQSVDATVKSMTIIEFASKRLINNEMTRTLLNKNLNEQLTEDDLFIAMEILRRKCVVGLSTHIEESMKRFLLYFGWSTLVVGEKVPMCQHELISNVNQQPPLPPRVGTEEYNALLLQNNLDVRLYEFTQYLFDYQGGNTRTSH